MRTAIYLTCCSVLWAVAAYGQCNGQNTPPSNASENTPAVPSGWATGASVTVYVNTTTYSSDQVSAIEAGFTNWHNSSAGNGVKYSFIPVTGQPVPTGNWVYVSQATPTDGGAANTTYQVSLADHDQIGYVDYAQMILNPKDTNDSFLTGIVAHEDGHLDFLGDCSSCAIGQSVMAFGSTFNVTNLSQSPSTCDAAAVKDDSTPPPPPPPPTCCTGGPACSDHYFCSDGGEGCQCEFGSPIIVDTTGKGFHLTPADEGVMFDISGDGRPIKIAWTAADSGNAFLALDRNGNGKIDSGKELFGNFTAQPKSGDPNGFLALAEFDKPENGGNGDGIIDRRDAVFAHLLLWIDENHDGVSQPNELHTLPELGVFSLALHYRDDRHFFDQYGNWFHYQAAVNPKPRDGKSKDGRVTYDVFFQVADDERGGTLSAAQSRVPGRHDPWLSLMGGGYKDGVLHDALALAPLLANKTRCRPQLGTTAQEVQK
jgi:hypothetical protein